MQDIVVAIVHKAGVYAYLQNRDGSWTFPGDTVADSEAPDIVALRAVESETGLTVRIAADLGVAEAGGQRLHYRICDYVSGDLELREPEKFSSAVWLSPAMLLNMPGQATHAPVAEFLRSRVGQCACRPGF